MPAWSMARLSAGAMAIERAWLSWSMPPPELALAESGWRPEAPGAACGRCGASIRSRSDPPGGGAAPCAECRGASLPYEGLVRLGVFEGDLADWVRAIKYRRWELMGAALGRLLGRTIAAGIRPGTEAVVVPMPMPLMRRMQRGTDHTATIAAAVAGVLRCPLRNILAHDGGPPQVSLPASQRRQRRSPFRLRWLARRAHLAGRTVVLIDDVRTTGATLRAAARLVRTLEPAGIVAGVLAVADAPDS